MDLWGPCGDEERGALMVGLGALEPPRCDWPSLTACCPLQLGRGKVRPLVGTCRDRGARVAAERSPRAQASLGRESPEVLSGWEKRPLQQPCSLSFPGQHTPGFHFLTSLVYF